MVFKNRNPIIILIAGKARSGKNTVSKILESEFIKEKKEVIISPYTKYLKEYIHNITDWNVEDENNKPRDLLQKLSSELIKEKLGLENIFINRQIEDIKIYSYFKDVIIINDVRFPKEIDTIKNIFTNVVSIQVKRSNYISGLTKEQLQDVTETSLDNYNNFDYIIENDDIESLKEDTINIFKSLQKRGEVMNKIIAIVGMCGSGKSIATDILVSKGYEKVYFGGVTMDKLKEENLEVNPQNEKMMREKLRKEYGMAAYAKILLPKILELSKKSNVVLDGLYSWDEYQILETELKDKFTTIAIVTDKKIRYNRLEKRVIRPLTSIEAKERDLAEINNIAKAPPIAYADYYICNNGSLEEYEKLLNNILLDLERK